MRVYNIVIIVLNTLIFLGLGLLLLGTGASDTVASALVGFHQNLEAFVKSSIWARVLISSIGLLFVVVSLSTIIGNAQNRRYERAVVFQNTMGEVMVTLGALEDLGRQVKADVPALKDMKLRVRASGKGLKVSASVVLWSDVAIPEATEQIQEAILRCFREGLGLEQEVRPRILVSKVAYRDPEDEPRRDEIARARKRNPANLV
jgi:hypothetical protein